MRSVQEHERAASKATAALLSPRLGCDRSNVLAIHTLQVFNEIGESEWSKPVAFATAASVPDAPHGLAAVEATTDSIALHWQVRCRSHYPAQMPESFCPDSFVAAPHLSSRRWHQAWTGNALSSHGVHVQLGRDQDFCSAGASVQW